MENCSVFLSQNINVKHMAPLAIGSHPESMRHTWDPADKSDIDNAKLRGKQRNIARILIKLCLNFISGFTVGLAKIILYLVRLNWHTDTFNQKYPTWESISPLSFFILLMPHQELKLQD